MSSPSPVCTVQDGGGTVQTTPPFTATAGNTITIALANTAGVNTWGLTLYGQDEAVTPPTVTINSLTKTATFTAPAQPWTLIYKSTVNGGNDQNGQAQTSYSTTVGIHCKTTANQYLAASNETVEYSATFGWTGKINNIIRNGAGSITLGGDVVGISSANTVTGLTGSAGTVAIAANNLTWGIGVTSPTITQTAQTAAVTNGQDLTIAAQNGMGSGASNGGNLILSAGASNTGSTGTVQIKAGGNTTTIAGSGLTLGAGTVTISNAFSGLALSQAQNTTGAGVAWTITGQAAHTGSAANGGNITIQAGAGDGAGTQGALILIGGGGGVEFLSTDARMITATWQWEQTIANPTLTQKTPTSNITPQNLVIAPQAPWNNVGATGANRTPGSLIVNIAAPTNGGTTEGYFQVARAGTVWSAIGPYPGLPTADSCLWLGLNGAAVTGNNCVIYSNGTSATFNVPGGGTGALGFNSSYNQLQWTSSGIQMYGASGSIQTAQIFTTSSDFLVLGATASSTGALRLGNNLAIKTKNAGGTADVNLVNLDASNNFNIGDSAQGATMQIYSGPSSIIRLFPAGANAAYFSSTEWHMYSAQLNIDGAVTPVWIQQGAAGTGAANGNSWTIQAQPGQAQTGTNANNNGGDLVLSPGIAGTGGSGAAGANGKLNFNNIITTTSVGAAGAASAMPTPVGYMNIKINGTAFRIAYFN